MFDIQKREQGEHFVLIINFITRTRDGRERT